MCEAPDITAAITNSRGESYSMPSGGTPLWPEHPEIRVWGEPYRHELRTVICSLGRIALFGDCFVSNDELHTVSEEALQSWRPALLAEFPGSYATIMQDDQRTTVLASITGEPKIYYRQHDRGVTIGTRPSLVAEAGGLHPNKNAVALHILSAGYGAEWLTRKQHLFNGLSELGDGQALEITRDHIYTYACNTLAASRPFSLGEGADALRQALEAGLVARLRHGTVSADFSGGFDSTSLAFLAARLQKQEKLDVFSAYLAAETEDGDRAYIERYLRLDDRLRPHPFMLPSPASFSHDDFLNTPCSENLRGTIATDAWIMIRGFTAFTDQYGGQLHLTGTGGDEVLRGGLLYLIDVLRRGNAKRFLYETAVFARVSNIPVHTLAAAIAELTYNPARPFERTAKRLVRTNRRDTSATQSPPNVTGWGSPGDSGITWLTPQIRADLADAFAEAAQDIRHAGADTISRDVWMEGVHGAAALGRDIPYQTRAAGAVFSPQSPLLDSAVVRAAFSVPPHLKSSPHHMKWLLQEALREIIPNEVFERRTKASGNVPLGRLYSQSSSALMRIIHESRLVDAGIIEPQAVQDIVLRADMMSQDDLSALRRFLATERWYRAIEDTRMSDIPKHKTPILTPHTNPQSSQQKTAEGTSKPSIRFAVPAYIHAVASPNGSLAVLNERTYTYHMLDKPQSDILRSLARGSSVEQIIAEFTTRYPAVSLETLTADIVGAVELLHSQGIIAEGKDLPRRNLPKNPKAPRFTSSESVISRPVTDHHTGAEEYLRVIVARGIDELLSHSSLAKLKMPLLRRIQQSWCNREATYDEAQSLLRTTQQVPWIGRLACIEAAYSTALAAALGRRVVAFHLGVTFQPLAYHAWVEAEGKAVRTPFDTAVIGSYQSFFV